MKLKIKKNNQLSHYETIDTIYKWIILFPTVLSNIFFYVGVYTQVYQNVHTYIS